MEFLPPTVFCLHRLSPHTHSLSQAPPEGSGPERMLLLASMRGDLTRSRAPRERCMMGKFDVSARPRTHLPHSSKHSSTFSSMAKPPKATHSPVPKHPSSAFHTAAPRRGGQAPSQGPSGPMGPGVPGASGTLRQLLSIKKHQRGPFVLVLRHLAPNFPFSKTFAKLRTQP